ncbi:hypothetical protein HL92_002780 [Salmonella enterica]|nr:hypothetical protein [Salmonella enterica]
MEPIVDAIKLRKTDGQASFEKMMEVVAGEIKKQICFRKIIDSIALNFASIVGGFTFFFCLYALLRFASLRFVVATGILHFYCNIDCKSNHMVIDLVSEQE